MTVAHRTFMFTDIVGSTARWDAEAALMLADVRRHDEILRATVERHDGEVFVHTGDGVGAAFETSSAACRAAREVISLLRTSDWAGEEPIRVRIGLHAGEAHHVDGNWFGPTVNRAARVADAATTSQILATPLVTGSATLHPTTTVVTHGRHTLKGLDEEVELLELALEGSSQGSPRVPPERRTNLPGTPPSVLGRDAEVGQLLHLLTTTNGPVTLVGPGGIGKTAVARVVAERYLETTGNPVWYVDLASASDSADIEPLILEAAGSVVGTMQKVAQLETHGPALLVLDNCDRVDGGLNTSPHAVATECPRVQVLATSRHPTGTADEILVPLDPLESGPDAPATQLLVDRLRRNGRHGPLDADELRAVEELGRLADGIPLAIELIAARARSLPLVEAPDLLRAAMGRSDAGVADRPSMGSVVGWSYERLDAETAEVFAGFSLFRGFDFDAAARLWHPDHEPARIAAMLDDLVTEGLVRFDGSRYRVLEPIRLFASQRLAANARRAEIESRMRITVAEQFERVASDWARLHPIATGFDRPTAVDATNARLALEQALEIGDVITASRLLKAAGQCLFQVGEFREVRRAAERILELARTEGTEVDRAGLLFAAGNTAWRSGDPSTARAALAEAAELYVAADDLFGTALATTFLAASAWDLGDLVTADREMADALVAWADVDDALFGFSGAPVFYWYLDHDPAVCDGLIERAADAMAEDGLDPHVREIRALRAIDRGDPEGAVDDLRVTAEHWLDAGNSGCLAHALEGAALAAVVLGEQSLAARLRAPIDEYRRESGIPALALELRTANRVDELLADARSTGTGEAGLGLPGAYAVFRDELWAP